MKTIHTRTFTGAGGLQLAADVGGDPSSPGVVLLHGGGQTRHSWSRAMSELVAQGFHVISLDARGHGDSEWSPDGDYRPDAMVSDLRAVLATLPSPPALVGASMGGATSLRTIGGSSEPVASALILVDMVARIEPEGAAKIAAFMRARPEGFASLEEAAEAVSAYNPHRPRPADPSGLMKNLRWRGGRLFWHWDPRFVAGFDAAEPPQFAESLARAARSVHVPTLLVRGLHSDIVSDAGVADLRANLPHLEVFDVAGAGHMIAGDKNDAFNEGVTAFLRRHRPASR